MGIIEENNYYPFGLKHKGYNSNVSSNGNATAQKYKFGGKEYQEELGLDWYDVTARNYDPALGRWMNLDPLAEMMRRHSPYNFAFNNPIFFIDPDGMAPQDTYGLQEDGSIVKIDEQKYYDDQGNEVDKLVANSTGNSIEVADGVLDTTQDNLFVSSENGSGDADFDTYQSTDVTNAENSKEIFEFAAENSNVEFSKMEFDTGAKTLLTSKDGNQVNGSSNVNSTTEGTLTDHSHSHPAGSVSNASPGDISAAGAFSSKVNGKVNFSIYHVDTKSYVPFSQFSSSFELEEIILK